MESEGDGEAVAIVVRGHLQCSLDQSQAAFAVEALPCMERDARASGERLVRPDRRAILNEQPGVETISHFHRCPFHFVGRRRGLGRGKSVHRQLRTIYYSAVRFANQTLDGSNKLGL